MANNLGTSYYNHSGYDNSYYQYNSRQGYSTGTYDYSQTSSYQQSYQQSTTGYDFSENNNYNKESSNYNQGYGSYGNYNKPIDGYQGYSGYQNGYNYQTGYTPATSHSGYIAATSQSQSEYTSVTPYSKSGYTPAKSNFQSAYTSAKSHSYNSQTSQKPKAEASHENPHSFPVSCGTKHKQTAEGYKPKRPTIPPDVMSRIAIAKSRLEIKPNDPQALVQLNMAMADYQHFHQEKQNAFHGNSKPSSYNGPGQFTGERLIEPMEKFEIDSDDVRVYARPDMFHNLKPLKDDYGKHLMKRMGWRDGKPLGKTGKGSLAPIEITVKVDRKGLMNEMECVSRKPEGMAKNEGPIWICKIINGKNSISGICELHQAMGIPAPVFDIICEVGGIYKWNVKTHWGSFAPFKASKSKKQAKSECAYNGLKEILKSEAKRLGIEDAVEAKDSNCLKAVFIPSRKSVGGQKMLYKHFYKSGDLVNILDRYELEQDNEYFKTAEFNARSKRLTKDQKNVIKTGHGSVKHLSLLAGANWMVKLVNGKNAASALIELCQAINKPPPEEYSQYMNGLHFFTLSTPWGTFTPPNGNKVRKEARKIASYYAIKEIMRIEAGKFASPPPGENPDSSESLLSFSSTS